MKLVLTVGNASQEMKALWCPVRLPSATEATPELVLGKTQKPHLPWLVTADFCELKCLCFILVTLYASCILLGVFLNSSVPIFFELFVETVYPVPEGITCGVVTFLSNMFMGVLLFFLTFYHTGKNLIPFICFLAVLWDRFVELMDRGPTKRIPTKAYYLM